MGRRGPKPLPTAIKQARGTDRADRKPAGKEPKTSPKTAIKIPESILASPAALRVWKSTAPKLRALKVLTSADLLALEALCFAQAQAEDAEAELRMHGSLTTVGAHGGLVAHPCVAIARQARTQIRQLCAEFGLTPSSRTRVRGESFDDKPKLSKGANADPKADPDGFLFGPRLVGGARGR